MKLWNLCTISILWVCSTINAKPEFAFSLDIGGANIAGDGISYSSYDTVYPATNMVYLSSIDGQIIKESESPFSFGIAGIIRSTFSEFFSSELRLGYYGSKEVLVFNEQVSADYIGISSESNVETNTCHKIDKRYFDVGVNGLLHYGLINTIVRRKGITFAPMLIFGGGCLVLAKGEHGYASSMPDSKESGKSVSPGSLDFTESFKVKGNAYYAKIGGGTELMVNIAGIYFRAGATKYLGSLYTGESITYAEGGRSVVVSYSDESPWAFDFSIGIVFYLN